MDRLPLQLGTHGSVHEPRYGSWRLPTQHTEPSCVGNSILSLGHAQQKPQRSHLDLSRFGHNLILTFLGIDSHALTACTRYYETRNECHATRRHHNFIRRYCLPRWVSQVIRLRAGRTGPVAYPASCVERDFSRD
jgi:hypothetical protein